jgi:hypothetical protein
MRCLVGHSWSPGIEKAPDEGALWVCSIGARNRLLATMNDFGRLLRSSENKLQYYYNTTYSSSSQADHLSYCHYVNLADFRHFFRDLPPQSHRRAEGAPGCIT